MLGPRFSLCGVSEDLSIVRYFGQVVTNILMGHNAFTMPKYQELFTQ
jgi:hypothetical protein